VPAAILRDARLRYASAVSSEAVKLSFRGHF